MISVPLAEFIVGVVLLIIGWIFALVLFCLWATLWCRWTLAESWNRARTAPAAPQRAAPVQSNPSQGVPSSEGDHLSPDVPSSDGDHTDDGCCQGLLVPGGGLTGLKVTIFMVMEDYFRTLPAAPSLIHQLKWRQRRQAS